MLSVSLDDFVSKKITNKLLQQIQVSRQSLAVGGTGKYWKMLGLRNMLRVYCWEPSVHLSVASN